MTKRDTKRSEKVRFVYNELSEKSVDGGVTPEMLLKASKAKSSLLHDNFEWDDTTAGKKFRLHQARQMLNAITIQIDSTRTREFQNIIVETKAHKTRKYYQLDQILTNEDLKKRVLSQIVRQLRTMMKRYTTYKEVYQLVNLGYLEELETKLTEQIMAI